MSLVELSAMEPSELDDRLAESRRELLNLRFQKATGQLDNTARIRQVKKEVARVLTVMRQRELGIDATGALALDVVEAEPEPEEGPAPRRRRARRAEAAEAGASVEDADVEDADVVVDEDDETEEEA